MGTFVGARRRTLAAATIVAGLAVEGPALAQSTELPAPQPASGAFVARAAEGAPEMQSDARDETGAASLAVRQSAACLITGSAATAAAIGADALIVTSVIGSGMVLAPTSAVFYVGLSGIVFATFCSIGAALTPLYLYLSEPPQPTPARPIERHASPPRTPAEFQPAADIRTVAFSAGVLAASLPRER